MQAKEIEREELIKFCSNPNLVNYVCLVLRPGLKGWMVELEYTKFKPDTEANLGFHLFIVKWPEEEPLPALTLAVVSIDKSGRDFADKILWKHGLQAKAGKVLTLIGSGIQEFFLQGPNVLYLENHSKGSTNVIYKNDPKLRQKADDQENAFIQKFFDEHERWINSTDGKAIADKFWADHPEGKVR